MLNAVDGIQTKTSATAIIDSKIYIFNDSLTSKLLKNNNFILNFLNLSVQQIRNIQKTLTNFSLNVASKKILYEILRISFFDKKNK